MQPNNTNGVAGLPPGDVTNGGTAFQNTGIVIPAGAFFRISVSGVITAGKNTAGVDTVCPTPPPSYDLQGSYGPLGTGGLGQEMQVLVKLVDSTGVGTAVNFPGYGSKSGPASDTSNAARAWTKLTVYVGHAGISEVCGHNNSTAGFYTLSGTHSVTVEQLTALAQLAADPPMVKKGHPVTFRVTSPDGYNTGITIDGWYFTPDPNQTGHVPSCYPINPCSDSTQRSGTMLAQAWVANMEFFPTAHVSVYSVFSLDVDSTTTKYGSTATFTAKYDGVPGPAMRWVWKATDSNTVVAADSAACPAGTTVCQKVMLRSGTMWAYTSTTVGQGESDNKSVSVSPPTILVSCGDSVTRGQTVTCIASGPAPLSITDWYFAANDPNLGGDSAHMTALSWIGPAVASGAVTVKGTVNGVAAISDTGNIAVRPRSWSSRSDTLRVRDDSGSFECYQGPHYADTVVAGWAGPPKCNLDYAFSPHVGGAPDSAVQATRVSGGPNDGFWYVNQLNARLEFHAQALKDYRPDGNKYTLASDSITRAACSDSLGTASAASVTQVNVQCQRNPDYSTFYSKLWRHEGCHATLAFQKFGDLPDPLTATEGVVATDSVSLVFNAFYAPQGLNETSGAVFAYSNAIDVMGSSQYNIWQFNPVPQTWWRNTSFVAHDYVVNLFC